MMSYTKSVPGGTANDQPFHESRRHGTRYGDTVALRCDDYALTFAEFDAAAARVATLLERDGIEPGDRVGIMLNTPAFALAFYGILRRGAIAVPMNPLLKAREIEFYLTNTGAVALFATPLFADEARAGRGGGERRLGLSTTPAGCADSTICPRSRAVERDDTDTAVILHTSGTTGKPKGAELTHGGLARNAEVTARTLMEIGPTTSYGLPAAVPRVRPDLRAERARCSSAPR